MWKIWVLTKGMCASNTFRYRRYLQYLYIVLWNYQHSNKEKKKWMSWIVADVQMQELKSQRTFFQNKNCLFTLVQATKCDENTKQRLRICYLEVQLELEAGKDGHSSDLAIRLKAKKWESCWRVVGDRTDRKFVDFHLPNLVYFLQKCLEDFLTEQYGRFE
jgi:hypothetical protein